MKKALFIAPALLALAAGPAAPGLPASIEIVRSDYFSGWNVEPTESSARIELELGDLIESAVVEVVARSGDERDLIAQFQVETSMTIMDEGPHLDLMDWKHHVSDWVDLERIDTRKFQMPKIESDYALASRFPTYTVDELYEVALAVGGDRWADLARQWPDPEDGRVGVGISTVRMRIVAREAGGTQTLFTLHIGVPMGC